VGPSSGETCFLGNSITILSTILAYESAIRGDGHRETRPDGKRIVSGGGGGGEPGEIKVWNISSLDTSK
ncbi:MAG: hypothetical protein QF363_03195, partial [Planctomycetaceae bacterium]|nr:hypothetical protein [Planctomycetaceae bacterium]